MGGKKFDQNKCKTQLKLGLSRIKLQKTKKDNMVKNGKREIAELLRAGKDESARIRVESIIRDDFVIEAYEILELFCELILARLGVINISKECPPDMQEAVATIIYAAPRAAIQELQIVRDQLIAKFGKEFAMNAVNNKDNIVNARVVHKLSVQTPENYLVFQYLNEIAKSYNIDWKADFVEPIQNLPSATTLPYAASSASATPTLHFPSPPSSNTATAVPFDASSTQLMFPNPPSPSSSSSYAAVPPVPSFPDVPSFASDNIPTFDATALPGVGNHSSAFTFPSPPSVNNTASSSSIPDFPSPPTTTSTSSGRSVPDFPSPPSSSTANSSMPVFPSPPSSTSGTGLDFPSPPTDRHSTNGNSGSTSGGLDFPTPPASDSANNNVPDFDELTARFEKLKRNK